MLRITTEWTAPGGPYYTTMHYDEPLANAQVAITATRALYTAIQGWFTSTYPFNILGEVAEVDPATGNTIATAVVTPSAGAFTGTGSVVPLTSQVLIRWRTGVYDAGREFRGRTFIPGFLTANVSSGAILGTVATQMTTAVQTWLAGPGVHLSVYSPTKLQVADVSSASVWQQFAVLRSRRD